jgi:protein-S-isoprenylcysteine O-methyltransferase Ste14
VKKTETISPRIGKVCREEGNPEARTLRKLAFMVHDQSDDIPVASSAAGIPPASIPPAALAGARRSRVVHCGNFLFAYRDYLFPLVFLLLLLTTKPLLPFGSERIDWWMDVLGVVVALAGQGCRFFAIGYVDNIRRGGRQKRVAASTLIRSGMFAHTRNPLYLGDLLIVGGLVLIASCPWWYLLVLPGFVGVYWSIVLAEEDFLGQKFGQDYVAYCQTVNRFAPKFTGLRRSLANCSFDWKRVVRKEYGIACTWATMALFLLIWKQWERFGYAARKTDIQELSMLFLLLLVCYGGGLWLNKSGRLKS